MKVALVIVVGSIALLKVELTALFIGTAKAPFAGFVDVIVGAVLSRAVPVVNVQGFGAELPVASALPAKSLAPAVMVAVNVALAARLLAGVKVAVEPA